MSNSRKFLALVAAMALGSVVLMFISGCQKGKQRREARRVNNTTPNQTTPAETPNVKPMGGDPGKAKPEPKKPEPKQPEPKKPEPKDPEPKKPEPKQPEPKKPEPKQPEPKQPEPKQPEPKQGEPKKPEPKQPEPKKPAPKDPAPKDKEPRVATKPDRPIAAKKAEKITTQWNQWGGSPSRNNVPVGKNVPITWNVGEFDDLTGEWKAENAKNVLWVARLGSQSYGNAVVSGGQVYVGTNNGAGHLPRYPADIDLGCLLAFDAKTGKFLWQHSSEKLSTGRVHDWPLQGICCAPLVEGERLWFVTSRGHVACLDTKGYYDGEDDGPVKNEWGRLFLESPDITDGLEGGRLSDTLKALLAEHGLKSTRDFSVETKSEGKSWLMKSFAPDDKRQFEIEVVGGKLQVTKIEGDKAEKLFETPVKLTAGLAEGKLSTGLKALLASRGMPVDEAAKVTPKTPAREWELTAKVDGKDRQMKISMAGPNLTAFKLITVDDKNEADVIWSFDMMKELGVSQHNMASCSVTSWGDLLFVNTSNGQDESHTYLPAPNAPSFICMDKNTGKVYWTDKSPGQNILHGQWSSPAVGTIGGVDQAIYAGGDGWVYSFKADRGQDGKPTLLWKFDANPKESKWIVSGQGTRNNIIATPVIYKERVYVAVGQDPEHGEGEGHLWCIDGTKRGDISPQLAVHVSDRTKPIPPRRIQAVIKEKGEVAIDNPNSGVIWHYSKLDRNNDGDIEFIEEIHRSCGTVAIKDDILYIADFSGLFHCLDAMTGKVYWAYDMMSAAWGSPLIVDGHVYIGNEDGMLMVFRHSKDPKKAMKEVEEDGEKFLEPISTIDMGNSVYSTPICVNNILYITNKTHLFAIANKESGDAAARADKPADKNPAADAQSAKAEPEPGPAPSKPAPKAEPAKKDQPAKPAPAKPAAEKGDANKAPAAP